MINIASQIIKHIWAPILFFILLIILITSTFLFGIRIEHLSIAGVSVEKLYIKLDKKLFVEIDKITINKDSQESSSKEKIIDAIKYYPYLNKFFNSIFINELHYTNELISFAYTQNSFFLDSKYLIFDIAINTDQNANIKATINELAFKDFDFTLYGTILGNIKQNALMLDGSFKTYNIVGSVQLSIKDMLLNYKLTTEEFDTLKPFMDKLCELTGLEDEISDWIYKKIVAKKYKLELMQGKYNLRTNDYFPKEIRAVAIIEDVIIDFEPSVPPANIQKLMVKLEDDNLIFDILKNATYEGVDLSKSKVHIYDLLKESGTGIVVDLVADATLNQTVLNILNAYGIKIPVLQKSGITKANVILDMRFLPFSIDAKGHFAVEDANLEIAQTPFYSKSAIVTLDNTIIDFKDANLVFKDIFDINANARFDIDAFKINGDAKINSLTINDDGEALVDAYDTSSHVLLDFNNDQVLIDINKFDTKLILKENNNKIYISNTKEVYPYSPFLQKNGILGANVDIFTKDFEKYEIDLKITELNSPLLVDEKKLDTLDLKITADDKQIVALSPHFKYKKTKELTTIDLMGLNVELNADDETSNDEDVPTQIFGYNSALMIPKYKITLPFKYYNAKLASRNIEFDGKLTQGEITLKSTNSEFSLHVENSSDQVLNKLLNKNIFEGGTFNLDINGKDSTNLSGHFHFNQTHLAQLKSYNNLIAFINTIPSLLFMKNAGFNESGIEVTKGDILFSRENDLVTVHNITLNGVSTDIVGGGIINLKDETMHFNLQIKTLKALSDTISKIPIVNYILLGDNQTLSTGVEISGSMSDPVVKTQVLQDTLSKPFDVIKNTIMLPFKIFQ